MMACDIIRDEILYANLRTKETQVAAMVTRGSNERRWYEGFSDEEPERT